MNCTDCEPNGILRVATRVISAKVRVCDPHYRERFNQPALITWQQGSCASDADHEA